MLWQTSVGLILSRMRQASSAGTGESISIGLSSMKIVNEQIHNYLCFPTNLIVVAGEFLYNDLIPERKLEDSIVYLSKRKDKPSCRSSPVRLLGIRKIGKQPAS